MINVVRAAAALLSQQNIYPSLQLVVDCCVSGIDTLWNSQLLI